MRTLLVLIVIIVGMATVQGDFSHASMLVLLEESNAPYQLPHNLELASRLYGIKVSRLSFEELETGSYDLDQEIGAIVISGPSLFSIGGPERLSELCKRSRRRNMPVFITALTPGADEHSLNAWSNGAIVRCAMTESWPSGARYKVANLRDTAQELSGMTFPRDSDLPLNLCYLVLNRDKKPSTIIEVEGAFGNSEYPIFVRTSFLNLDVYFEAGNQTALEGAHREWEYLEKNFLEIAPMLMFLRQSFGEECWHSPGNYANLSIDDPWLIEPYGHLSYKKLLDAMRESNFHTTIAFIPWNFDRSRREVADFLRDSPTRISFCIHGNNHDHEEFSDSKPLDAQEGNIRQAIARMEMFKDLTGISYDRLMVFPHRIASPKTLGLLKKYNFLATANLDNIPSGHDAEKTFNLFSGVLSSFGKFPSLKRHVANMHATRIAIDSFLGSPILLCAHHDFSARKIDVAETARTINRIQPQTEWTSLGDISKRLYLQKLRDDGAYDIISFTSNLMIRNTHPLKMTYFVRKEESFDTPIKTVKVNDDPYRYEKSQSALLLRIELQPFESAHIVIEYENDLDLDSTPILKDNFRVSVLRWSSDIRDLIMTRNAYGQILVQSYYDTGLFRLGLRGVLPTLLLCGIAISIILYWAKGRAKRKN